MFRAIIHSSLDNKRVKDVNIKRIFLHEKKTIILTLHSTIFILVSRNLIISEIKKSFREM